MAMNGASIFGLVIHWLHLVAAACAVGGALFQRMVVWPALQRLEGAPREELDHNVRSRMGKIILHSSLLAIITGIVNIYRVTRGQGYALAGSEAFKVPMLFWIALLGHFVLALSFFCLSVLLILPTEDWKRFNDRRPFWMAIAVLLGFGAFLFAAWMRLIPR